MIMYVWSASLASICGIILIVRCIIIAIKKYNQNQLRTAYEEIE
jgi:hypothetical protein